MQRLVCAAAAVLLTAASAGAAISSIEAQRLAKAAAIVQEMHESIRQDYWNRARCVVVIPELKKAAFIVGGEYGKGVLSCKAGDQWTAPVFMQLAKGSWGFQAGAEQVDLVMLVMNESGVQKLLKNKVTLGADASVAAGPMGAAGTVATDAALTAEILAYSRAKGLFAGINLSGGVLRPDEDANRSAYGAGASPTTDDDLTVQLTSMQQTLDRLISNAASSPVGTTGNAGATESGTLVVDRAALMQLRQQLAAAIAALNRR